MPPVQQSRCRICNYTGLESYKSQTLLPSLYLNLTNVSTSGNNTYIIDNTFYPCRNGAYQPELYLAELINISIQENQYYGILIKISTRLSNYVVFVLLLQIMMVIIAYLVIMFRKYRKLKKRLEFLKGQEEAQDLLNSFLLNNTTASK